MSIIYSYPTSQPTVDDLLIGTDVNDENATKSFTVQSLVSLINAANGSGTVTSVQIATDAFLSAIGGPIVDAGVITIGLTATGSPSASTFLRGDNQWVTPTVSCGISIFDENSLLTSDVSSINFVGAGVTSSSDSLGNTTVNILGPISTVDTVSAGTGISVNQTTGDIVVTNAGVTSIVAGTNITLTGGTTTGQVTINSTGGGGAGSVTIVQPGTGLVLEAGSTTSDPTIGIDYAGDSTYITVASSATIDSTDSINFQDGTAGVRKTTLADIPATALTLVNTAITQSVADVVKNNTDTYTSVGDVDQVITLTDAEYTAIATKDGNTLYLTTTTAAASFTKTLVIDATGITGTEYTLTGNVAGDTQSGASGSNYAFSTGISLTNGYQWASGAPTITQAQGQFTSTGNVTTNLGTGTIEAIPAGTGSALVTIIDNLTKENGAVSGTNYQIAATTNPLSGTAPFTYTSSNFGVAASIIGLAAEWEVISPVYSYSPTSGTVQSGQTAPVTCTVSGTVRKKNYTLTYNIIDSNSNGTRNVDYTISNVTTGQPFTGVGAPLTETTGPVPYGTAYNFNTNFSNVSGSGTSTTVNSRTLANPITGNITANVTLSNTIVSTTSATSGTVVLSTTNQIVSPDGSGTGTGYTATPQYSIGSGSTNWQTYTSIITQSNGTPVNFRYVFTSSSGYTNQTGPTFSAITPITINNGAQTATTTLSGTVIEQLTLVQFATSTLGSAALACSDYPGSNSYYHDGSGSYPAQSDKIYSDTTGLNPLANGFYAVYYGSTVGQSLQITTGGVVDATPIACPTAGTATLTTTNNINPNDGTGYTATAQYKIDNGAWVNGSTITANIGQVISFQYVFSISTNYTAQVALAYSSIPTITISSTPQTASTTLTGTVVADPQNGTATLTTINQIVSPDGTGTYTGYTAQPQYKIDSGAWINGSTITANVGQVISFQYTFNISPGYVAQTALAFSAINTITISSTPQTTSTTLSGAVIEQLTTIQSGTAMKSSALLACNAYGSFPQYFYYHNGSGTYPVQGNKVYSDSAGNNPLANGYYAFYYGTATAVSMQVTTGGVLVQNPTTC